VKPPVTAEASGPGAPKETWYFTFGWQYSRQEHPRMKRAHPDGVLEVKAKDYSRARDYVISRIGPAWEDILEQRVYEINKPEFPLGVLETWDAPDYDEFRVVTSSPHTLDRVLEALPSTVAEVVDGSYDGESCVVRCWLGGGFAKYAIEHQGYGQVVTGPLLDGRVIERPQMTAGERLEDHS
jgi:hypothetical protein